MITWSSICKRICQTLGLKEVYVHMLVHCVTVWHFLTNNTKGVPKLLSHASLRARNAIYRETKYVSMKCSSKRNHRVQNQPKPTIMPAIHRARFTQIWNSSTIRANKLRIANLHKLLFMHYSWIRQIHDLRTHLRTIANDHKPVQLTLVKKLPE